MVEQLIAWYEANFVAGWREAWKNFSSVRFGAYAAVATSVWNALSDEQRTALLNLVGVDVKWLVPIGCVVAVYLRLKKNKDEA